MANEKSAGQAGAAAHPAQMALEHDRTKVADRRCTLPAEHEGDCRGPITAPAPAAEAELEALKNLPDSAIDTSDIPEVIDWSKAERGKFYRKAAGAGTWDARTIVKRLRFRIRGEKDSAKIDEAVAIELERAYAAGQAALRGAGEAPLNQRGWDLLRQMRHHLFNERLITQEEYTHLLTGIKGSVARLEDYDKAMAAGAGQAGATPRVTAEMIINGTRFGWATGCSGNEAAALANYLNEKLSPGAAPGSGLPYWQCPNDESHTLEFKSRDVTVPSGSRCKICGVDAVFRPKPAPTSVEASEQARLKAYQWMDENIPRDEYWEARKNRLVEKFQEVYAAGGANEARYRRTLSNPK